MRLSEEKIKAEVQSPSKAAQIRKAIIQQDRIKFHVDTNVEVIDSEPYRKFKTFVSSFLPADKFMNIMNLNKFPLPTNKVSDEIWTKLGKIFDGRNPAINYQFNHVENLTDWNRYRTRVLKEPTVWSHEAWEFFKTEFNGIVVVDMPEKPTSGKPEPYFYFVPIDSVISYDYDYRTKNMNWVIFRYENRIIVIDGETYRSYAYEDSVMGKLLGESKHGLSFCPARFFWNESLSLSEPDVKRSPLSKALGDFDWYLFWTLAKKHLDLYGSFPIYSGYEQECDYTNAEGDTCSHGFLKGIDGHYKTDEFGNTVPCPLCHGKKYLAGPGTYVEVPVPDGDSKDLRNPVQVLTIDKDSLTYCVEEMERLKRSIINSCVGRDNSILNETSLADKQVDATYESQDNVLNRIKQGFEDIQCWVDTVCCTIRYKEDFLGATINYGTEFYTLTPEVLQKRYEQAKKSGASYAILDALDNQFVETTYRHNPEEYQRIKILAELEPYRHLSVEQATDLFEKNVIDATTLRIKLDFPRFIRKFERENINIVEFGSQLPFYQKIDTIYKTLVSYAETNQQSSAEQD